MHYSNAHSVSACVTLYLPPLPCSPTVHPTLPSLPCCSLKVLKRSATYVHFLGGISLMQPVLGFLRGALWMGPRYRVVLVFPNGAKLAQIAELAAKGQVKPIIESVMPLEKAA